MKQLLLILAITTCFFSSCKKEEPEPNPWLVGQPMIPYIPCDPLGDTDAVQVKEEPAISTTK